MIGWTQGRIQVASSSSTPGLTGVKNCFGYILALWRKMENGLGKCKVVSRLAGKPSSESRPGALCEPRPQSCTKAGH